MCLELTYDISFKSERKMFSMIKRLRTKITKYRTAMVIVKKMLDEGIIGKKEYDELDTIIAEKCGLDSCTIFR